MFLPDEGTPTGETVESAPESTEEVTPDESGETAETAKPDAEASGEKSEESPKPTLASLLGQDPPKAPAPKAEQPSAETERIADLESQLAEANDRLEGKSLMDKVIEKLPEGFDPGEAREQLEFISPLVRSQMSEIVAPLQEQISALTAALETNQQAKDATAWAEGQKVIRSQVEELGKATGTGIHEFPEAELTAEVQRLYREEGISVSDDEEGYMALVQLVNQRLQVSQARGKEVAKKAQVEADTRKVPGGRSRSNKSVSDLKTMSVADRRKELNWRERR